MPDPITGPLRAAAEHLWWDGFRAGLAVGSLACLAVSTALFLFALLAYRMLK